MIGPDLLAGILVITTMFKESPNTLILKYINAIRGNSTVEKDEVMAIPGDDKMPLTNSKYDKK